MHVSSRFRLSARLLCAACLLAALPVAALEKVTLQLKWTHAFQFAGYYAAKELGYYEKAGLDVRLVEAGPGIDPVEEVLAGRAQYGVGTSSLVVERGRGKPVVALAVIFQHSPQVFIGRRGAQTRGLRDLVGKRVMIEPQSRELEAFLLKEGVSLGDLRVLPHSHDPQDLMDGKVDAMSAYLTFETYFFDRASFPYRIYAPRELGLDFYGDNLFTTESEVRQHPARAAAFREASLRGWAYALENPQEIADLILARYSREHPRAFYLHEAVRMTALVTHELVAIGHMHPGRWRQIAETYAEMGMMPAAVSLEGFLYEPGVRVDLRRYYAWIAAALALVAVVGGLALYVQRTNLRLRRALETSRQAQEALREGGQRLRLLAEHASDVIWTRDLEGRFTYVSPSVTKLRGFTVEEVMAQSVEDAYTPESAALVRENLARLMATAADGRTAHEFRGEFELKCKGGAKIWVETTLSELRDADGRVNGIVGVTRDISARRAAEQRMSELALHDALTGLPNRTLFSDRLQQALVAAQRERRRLAVMFIDLDKFKPVNDRHGHAVGDLLLKEVAHRMLACVRGSDTVARIGGDEFVVLLRTVEGGPFALAVAEKIRHALDQAFEVSGLRLEVSCCVGIALYPDDGTDEIALAKNADAAMYWAKEHGRDNVQLYRPEMARGA